MDKASELISDWLSPRQPAHTKSELAAELGVSTRTIENKLDGSTRWTWDEMKAVSRLLGVSLDELAGGAAPSGAGTTKEDEG